MKTWGEFTGDERPFTELTYNGHTYPVRVIIMPKLGNDLIAQVDLPEKNASIYGTSPGHGNSTFIGTRKIAAGKFVFTPTRPEGWSINYK